MEWWHRSANILFSVVVEAASKFNMQLKFCSFSGSEIMSYKAQNT